MNIKKFALFMVMCGVVNVSCGYEIRRKNPYVNENGVIIEIDTRKEKNRVNELKFRRNIADLKANQDLYKRFIRRKLDDLNYANLNAN